MAIQQNVNQILSLSAVFARMSPLGEMAEHKKAVASAEKAYKQQNDAVESVKRYHAENQIFPREEQLSAAKRLYQLNPTEELAGEIRGMERGIRGQEEKIAKTEAARAMRVEKMRQDADRAREARLKILEGVPLSAESEVYTKKLLESNTPAGQKLIEKKSKKEEPNNG